MARAPSGRSVDGAKESRIGGRIRGQVLNEDPIATLPLESTV